METTSCKGSSQANDFTSAQIELENGERSHVVMTKKLLKTKNQMGRTIINGKYTMLDVLGRGTYAKVRLAKIYDESHFEVTPCQYFAVKIYFKLALKSSKKLSRTKGGISRRRSMTFTTALDEVYQEIEIMKHVAHDHVLKLIEVIDDPDCEKLYCFTALSESGELMSWDNTQLLFHPNF